MHCIEVNAFEEGKVSTVSLYPAHAEVTRSFTVGLTTGVNKVKISGLPNTFIQESLRVDGRGCGTINDVTVSSPIVQDDVNPKVAALNADLERTNNALARAQSLLSSNESYLGSVTVQYVDISQLKEISQNYETVAKRLHEEVVQLTIEKSELEKRIREAENRSALETGRTIVVSIAMIAERDGDVELTLVYGVSNAKWTCLYDVRVETNTSGTPSSVAIGYKASITQNTGEDWNNGVIKLETTPPMSGMAVPSLSRWVVSSYRFFARPEMMAPSTIAPAFRSLHVQAVRSRSPSPPRSRSPSPRRSPHRSPHRHRHRSSSGDRCHSRGRSSSRSRSPVPPTVIQIPGGDVPNNENMTNANVNASFTVPGRMTIPSDNTSHLVPIAQIPAEAALEWVCVPKRDTRVYLRARVTNKSEYTLLQGPADVYVDGSFVAKAVVPLVRPDEAFDCALGLDPSVQVTYSPLSSKTTMHTGFMTKAHRVQTFTQWVTVQNTKPSMLAKVKVIDHVPVSEEHEIVVKVLSPALNTGTSNANHGKGHADASPMASPSTEGNGNRLLGAFPVEENADNLGEGVVAQWEGVDDDVLEDERNQDLSSIADGKFAWVCSNIPAQGTVKLLLQWEVSAPKSTYVYGL